MVFESLIFNIRSAHELKFIYIFHLPAFKVYGHFVKHGTNHGLFIPSCLKRFCEFVLGLCQCKSRCTSVHSWKSSNLIVKYSIYQINNELSGDFLSIVWFCMFNSISFFVHFTVFFYSLIGETPNRLGIRSRV